MPAAQAEVVARQPHLEMATEWEALRLLALRRKPTPLPQLHRYYVTLIHFLCLILCFQITELSQVKGDVNKLKEPRISIPLPFWLKTWVLCSKACSVYLDAHCVPFRLVEIRRPFSFLDRNYTVQYGPNNGRPKLRCLIVQYGANLTVRIWM